MLANVSVAWRSFRPLAMVNLLAPLLLGAFSVDGKIDSFRVLFWAIWLLLAQATILFWNDIGDAELKEEPTLISGGSTALEMGEHALSSLRKWAVFASVLLCLFPLAISLMQTHFEYRVHPLISISGFLTLALTLAYSVAPIRLCRWPAGGLLQAFGVGVVLPSVGAFVAGDSLVEDELILAIVLAALGGHISTALPDLRTDRAGAKMTIAVVLGAKKSLLLAFALLAFAAFVRVGVYLCGALALVSALMVVFSFLTHRTWLLPADSTSALSKNQRLAIGLGYNILFQGWMWWQIFRLI